MQYRWTFYSSVALALAIAVLWGSNIGAVYPFVEVVFQGKSLHQWADSEVETAQKQMDEAQRALDSIDRQLAVLCPPTNGRRSSDACKRPRIRRSAGPKAN